MTGFLPPGSPLRNPPSSIALKQRVALDGIRLALDVLAESWNVLLLELTILSKDRESTLTPSRLASIYMHAWNIIDVIHRLRLLVVALPGLKRTPGIEVAIREFREVRALRDGFQHIDERLKLVADQAWPLWGSVSWLWSPAETLHRSSRLFTLIVGGIRDSEVPAPNPLGQTVSVPLGLVTVNAFGQSVELSKHIDRVQGVAQYLDSTLRLIPNPEGGMADILMSLDIATKHPK